jgi:hypothetical protein
VWPLKKESGHVNRTDKASTDLVAVARRKARGEVSDVAWRKNNPEHSVEYSKAWAKNNPEKKKASNKASNEYWNPIWGPINRAMLTEKRQAEADAFIRAQARPGLFPRFKNSPRKKDESTNGSLSRSPSSPPPSFSQSPSPPRSTSVRWAD